MGFAHLCRMGLTAMIFDVPNNPVTVSLFCATGVIMVVQNLPYLIHRLQLGIGYEFRFYFHFIGYCHANMENVTSLFPCLVSEYKI